MVASLQLLTTAFGPFRPIPPYAICVRFRGIAEVGQRSARAGHDANDPLRKSGEPKCCDAQHGVSKDMVGCDPRLEGST